MKFELFKGDNDCGENDDKISGENDGIIGIV